MLEDTSNHRRAIASVCYINQRNKRRFYPRFLRRNLTRVLDSHQKQLHAHPNAVPREDMIANERRRWGWDFPTTDMLQDYMNGRKPVLQLEALRLRTPDSKATIATTSRQRAKSADELDWLPNPAAEAIYACTVGIAISLPRDAQSSKRQIHYESLPATILQLHQPELADGAPYFDVKLQKPFFFKVDKLFVVTDSGTNGGRSWKKTTTASYVLDVSIQCHESHDSSRLFSALEGKDAGAYQDAPSNEGLLKATWDRLPTCPSDGQLVTLRRSKGHKSLELDYQLEMAMGWIKRRDYVLKTYNKLNDLKQAPGRQLPTPSASEDMEKVKKGFEIVWSFNDGNTTRNMPVKALKCALCQDNRHFTCFAYLVLHCKRNHDHFTFHTEDVIDQPDSSSFHATIVMTPAPPTHEKLDAEEDRNMNWVAPDRPFNIDAYLRGRDDWVGQSRPRNKKGVARPVKERDTLPVPSALPARKRPPLDEVQDLPRHMPKKHRVPNVPGVTFYHTTSKQPIEPGSLIVESDDEIDEFWLAQSQSRALDDLGITGAAKDFTRAFNQHLAREQSDSSLLTRDALVRFTREHRTKLQDLQWERLFRAKLKQFTRAGIITDDVVTYCIRLIRGGQSRASAEMERDMNDGENAKSAHHVNGESSRPRINGMRTSNDKSTSPEPRRGMQRERKKWAGGKTVLRESGISMRAVTAGPSSERPDSLSRDQGMNGGRRVSEASTHKNTATCICGKSAKDARGSIACADPRCARRDYHLSCVKLDKRIPGWRCSDCST